LRDICQKKKIPTMETGNGREGRERKKDEIQTFILREWKKGFRNERKNRRGTLRRLVSDPLVVLTVDKGGNAFNTERLPREPNGWGEEKEGVRELCLGFCGGGIQS